MADVVYVFDDDEGAAKDIVADLNALFRERKSDWKAIEIGEIQAKDAYKAAKNRRADFWAGRPWTPGDEWFDSNGIFIVDFDLTDADSGTATGQELAYFLQVFCKVSSIVLMNRDQQDVFDLEMVDSIAGYEDSAVPLKMVTHPQFWGIKRENATAYWPSTNSSIVDLNDVLLKFKNEVGKVPLSTPMFGPDGVIPIDEKHLGMAPTHVMDGLSKQGRKPGITIQEVLLDDRLGFRSKDLAEMRDQVLTGDRSETAQRVAVHRISAWANRSLLPTQSVLVDKAHLIDRLPEAAAGRIEGDHWVDVDIVAELEEFMVASWALLGPVWNWIAIEEARENGSLSLPPVNGECAGLRFCEATSAFVPLGEVTRISTSLGGRFAVRFVRTAEPAGIEYVPISRFGKVGTR